MSNQAFSVSEDLMVGAGVLYFKRNDDTNGFHHLGNVEEFTISNDVDKVEKNSSMNKKRELMASVITAIKPSAKLTLNEYNPYNLALGLFGVENVQVQQPKTLVDEPYTVISVPGIIQLADADGNRYFDVSNITVKPASTIPASFKAKTVTSDMSIQTTTSPDDTLKDNGGGILELSTAAFSGTDDVRVFITVKTAPTASGDLDGLTLEVREGLVGAPQTFNVTTASTQTKTFTLTSGATIKATVGVGETFTANANMNEAALTASISTYEDGKDYLTDAQESRAGIIKIRDGGRIKTGDIVKVSATVPKAAFPTVSGGNAGDIEGELLFVGDPNIGGLYNLEAWHVKITPDGDLSGLIGTDFGSFGLTVNFLTDYENHPKYPYYKLTMISRASGKQKVEGVYDPHY